MRKFILGLMLVLAFSHQCFAYGSISCGAGATEFRCFAATSLQSAEQADAAALANCASDMGLSCTLRARLTNECVALASPSFSKSTFSVGRAQTIALARQQAAAACSRAFNVASCEIEIAACDEGLTYPKPAPRVAPQASSPAAPLWVPAPAQQIEQDRSSEALSDAFFRGIAALKLLDEIERGTGWALVIAFVAWVLIASIRLFIHGVLPETLINYGEDIEVLFTRTQRVNWYGRVVFGVVARLAMTEQQLLLVRRYWLGRVIAFDSFRRQRQNQLAKFHLQLAAVGGATPIDTRTRSLFWIVLKRIVFSIFYALRALISFLFGFLFLRVTIASLARGKLIETKDLTLMLEAKDAIEETASYLKEYLEVAETFDGREELFEPEGPIDAVLEALHGRREARSQGDTRALRRGREALSS